MSAARRIAASVVAAAAIASAAAFAARAASREPSTSCISCHAQAEEEPMRAAVDAWPVDVHAAAGLGCESCHGGDATLELAEDGGGAMDPAKGFKPTPSRLDIPDFCGRCHADPAFMKRYNPQARVDQLAEYRTSVHGKKNAAGDSTPATCIDCHGVHGIRPVSSPESPAYAANVPRMCAGCHADAAAMAPYGIPTNQFEDYSRSVHAAALLEKGDNAAPACNDCHGNHGAAPPGVGSVAHVCGHCHGREGALFRESFKQPLFENMSIAECSVCHEHHRIRHPTPEMLNRDSAPTVSAGNVTSADPFAASLGDIAPGDTVVAAWRAVLAPHAAPDDPRLAHRVEVAVEGAEPLALDATVRPHAPLPAAPVAGTPGAVAASLSIAPLSGLPIEPGDAILFRLAVTANGGGVARGVTVRDLPGPVVAPHTGSVCFTCHSPGDSCDDETGEMYAALDSLDRNLRAASALLHRAHVAGMEVSGPLFELKSKGTTAAVEARALIHAFDQVRLTKRTAEGMAVAEASLAAGRHALREREVRRRGLAVSLVLVAFVLVGLRAKIRDVERRRAASDDRAR
jgi:hypothetical protein